MDMATETTQQKQARFLRHCLQVMSDDLCGNNEALLRFYDECLRHLESSDSLSSGQLRELDQLTPDERRITVKGYINRLRKLAGAIESNRNKFEGDLSQFNLRSYPKIEYMVGGGGGNESRFFVSVETSSNDAVKVEDRHEEVTKDHSERTASTAIRYKTEKISRPPWYLKVAAPFFKTQRTRLQFALTVLAVVFMLLPVTMVISALYSSDSALVLAAFTVLLSAQLLLTPVVLKILRVMVRKIVIVDSIRLPLSSVCISEVEGVSKSDPSTATRKLSVVTISADCPTCKALYGLEKSVWLEQKGFINGSIIGVCHNNPMMHRYTFDKDLMAGVPIRTP